MMAEFKWKNDKLDDDDELQLDSDDFSEEELAEDDDDLENSELDDFDY
jgi:hypothetical protein